MIKAVVELQRIKPRWDECIVAATGPSLTQAVAEWCRYQPVLAVNDAYRLIPFAEVLYACDGQWWEVHDGCPGFHGEKWSSHSPGSDEKIATAERYGLNLIRGTNGEGFSLDPSVIYYGSNSGFQAINLAILFGARRIILVGFDMRDSGPRHFFGNHPDPLTNSTKYSAFIQYFDRAAEQLPQDIEIINCTPGSALTCFPVLPLGEVWPGNYEKAI